MEAAANDVNWASINWASMSPAQRCTAFDNDAQVGHEVSGDKIKEWKEASDALRRGRLHPPPLLDVVYAKGHDRAKWDLYPADRPDAPCLIHLHGGLWQHGGKEKYACVAQGALELGWSAALPGYTLAPEASLADIVKQLRSALDWFQENAKSYGISGPAILSGWSAGAHLTAMLLDHPRVAAGLAVSGVFELGPLRDVPRVNDKLQLTDAEIAELSPLRIHCHASQGFNKRLCIAYGSEELPSFIASSCDFHAQRASFHLPGDLVPVASSNHFTVLDELRARDGQLTRALLQLAHAVFGESASKWQLR